MAEIATMLAVGGASLLAGIVAGATVAKSYAKKAARKAYNNLDPEDVARIYRVTRAAVDKHGPGGTTINSSELIAIGRTVWESIKE